MVRSEGSCAAYVGGGEGRPLPAAAPYRKAHEPRKPQPTGLDWDKHRAPASQPGAAATSTDNGGPDYDPPPMAVDSQTVERPAKEAAPAKPAPTSRPAPQPVAKRPAYVDDVVRVLVAAESHPDASVRAARKVVANGLVQLNRALAEAGQAGSRRTRRGALNITPEQSAEICRRYLAGESTHAVAKAMGVGQTAVVRHLERGGVQRRPVGRKGARS